MEQKAPLVSSTIKFEGMSGKEIKRNPGIGRYLVD
jgi:hypothetical protein